MKGPYKGIAKKQNRIRRLRREAKVLKLVILILSVTRCNGAKKRGISSTTS